jgi:glyoxylase-like metal-dependent hydrolase (beta-lactamase superfamily II)
MPAPASPAPASHITKVSIVSTGSVEIRPQHVRGTGTPMLWWLLTSRRWTAPRPINVYVIEHRDGLVLFDTGQDRASVTDPHYFPRGILGFFYRRLARFAISAGDTLTAQLAALGYRASDVTMAILSHLHQDHIGGIAELPNAEIVVSASDWSEIDKPGALLEGVMADHVRLPGVTYRPVDIPPAVHAEMDAAIAPFTHALDLRGDGSLLLLPTPGHSPGSMSLLVRAEGWAAEGLPPLLLVGDLTYDVSLLVGEHVPGVGERKGLLASTRAVLGLRKRHPELVVLAAHDPAASGLLTAAIASAVAS